MIRRDFHVHTTFCDGHVPAEETVLEAISKGMDMLGFSGHAYTSRDAAWCMSSDSTTSYKAEILRLREKYKDKIKILLGAEQDYFSDGPMDGYDYRIGSVHYIEAETGGADLKLLGIDESPEQLVSICNQYFGGDMLRLAERYYEYEGRILDRTGADVIGHFNLIEKFNEGDRLFDTADPRYVRAWQSAADRLLPYGKPFEVNTGAMSRGYRTEPYPSGAMMDYIAANGGTFLLSSDSHAPGTLLYGFEELEPLFRRRGYRLADQP